MIAVEGARPELALLMRAELARRNLGDFCALMDARYERPRHTDVLIKHLEALERRDIESLMVFLPPRSSKSYHVSERFPAWALGRDPSRQVILASYGSELAERNSRVVRGLVADSRYPFPTVVARDSGAVNRWATDAGGGGVLAAGVGSALTGFGAHLLIIDDPIKDRESADSELQRDRVWEWYGEVARTRLMPRAVQLLTQTRWHDNDLAGRILNSEDAKRWTVLSLPAIAEENDVLGRAPGEALWPEWYSREFLDQQRTVMGSRAFAAVYQQSPVPATGGTFKPEWFTNRYDRLPDIKGFDWIVIQAIDGAWKTGIANDFSVIATWATNCNGYFLIDVCRRKLEFYDLKRVVVEKYREFTPRAVYCEEAASGYALLSELRRTTGIEIIGVPAQNSKEARAEAVAPMLEAGRVWLPERASWLDEWVHEHLRFPGGAHDDQVDTTSLALLKLRDAALRRAQSYVRPPLRFRSWR